MSTGLARADFVLSVGSETAQDGFEARYGKEIGCPHLRGHLEPLQTGLPMEGMPVVAFAGIGHPEKFFATLRGMGADLRAVHPLTDHQPLSDTLMTRMLREASALGAQVVTTEKDAVRLSPALRPKVMTVPVRLRLDDWSALDAALDRLFPR